MRHRFRYTQHFHLSICFRIRIVLCQFLQKSTKKSRLGELGVAYQLENYNAQCSVANKREKVKKKKRRRHTFLSSIHPSIHPLHQWAFQFAFFEFSCNRIPFSLIKHLLAEQKPVAFPAFSVFFFAFIVSFISMTLTICGAWPIVNVFEGRKCVFAHSKHNCLLNGSVLHINYNSWANKW